MSRYFLFGTLMWDALLTDVAGGDVGCIRATLNDWSVERAAAGDWPVLVCGGQATGYLTAPLDGSALVYREVGGAGGAGVPWSLTDWVAAHGARTRLAAAEVMRGMGRVTPAEIAARRDVVQSRAEGIVAARNHRRVATVGGEGRTDQVDVQRVDYPYEGFHRVEEWHLDYPRFDGTRSGVLQRAISHATDAATVLPYDPVRDRVLLVEQIRIGALAKGDPQPWMLEPVAGLIDAGETAETAAIRETAEEAGLNVDPQNFHFVGRYYPSPGGLAQILHSYVAVCDLPDDSDGLHGLDGEDEDIRVHVVPLDDLLAMVASGEAVNAPLIISAQWLALNRDTLRG